MSFDACYVCGNAAIAGTELCRDCTPVYTAEDVAVKQGMAALLRAMHPHLPGRTHL